ncbi:MAG: OsmC family protein [Spirochaeta sp.]|nr:OsmC family protein [Spirochaeta sp.]
MDKKREMSVSITGESQNPTKITLKSGNFSMIIDEPKEMGGTDEGPSPIQVLLMSLAGCLNVTGHEIARQKGLTLHGIKIGIEGVMNPCTFLGCSFEERAGFQNINVKIEPDFTDATQQQIDEWLKETEERCPVTDNIKAGTSLSVSVK